MKTTAKSPSQTRQGTPFRSQGNRSNLTVQTKLRVNKPGDSYETEADQAAEKVVKSKPAVFGASPVNIGSAVQKKESEDTIQEKPIAHTITPFIQRKEEDAQMKEEESAQMKEEEPVQAKEDDSAQMKEDDVQAKEEEPAQMKEEDLQAKEDESAQMKEAEIAPDGMADQMGQEDPIREEAVQSKEEESAQMKEEEPVQAKEDDSAQMKEDDVQAKEKEPAQMKEEESVQAKEDEPAQMKEEEEVQAKELVDAPPVSQGPPIGQKLQESKGNGTALPSDVKTEMESGFGADFSNVKIHTGSKAEEMSSELGAQAFTNKGDIYFNKGKFDPASDKGKFLLAHELTHTIQQGAAAPKDKETEKEESKSTEKTEEKKSEAENKIATAKASGPADEKTAAGPVTPAAGTAAAASGNPTAASSPAEPAKIKEVKPNASGVIPPQEAVPEQPKAEAPAEPEIANPESDPNFQEVVGKIEVTAEEQQEHAPAGTLSKNAQEAAPSPSNERKSMAEANQVEEMDEQQPKAFNEAEFKKKLMAKIAEMQLPDNQEKAEDFEHNNNIDKVNKSAVADVSAEKEQAAGPIEQSSNAAPNTAAVPERKTTTLKPAKPGPKPKGVGAGKAVPGKRSDAQVSAPLENEAMSLDQKMTENNVTDHQLEISNEPTFQQGLDSKNEAKANAKEAPQEFRKKEEGVLQNNATQAETASHGQLAQMNKLRGGAFAKVLGNQKATGNKDTSERAKISGKINEIYGATKKDVDSILDALDDKVSKRFEYYSNLAKKDFEKYVAYQMKVYKYKRYLSQPGGSLLWIRDLFMGLPDEVNQFFVEGKKIFTLSMDKGITNIAHLVGIELNRAKTRIQRGKNDVNKYVESLPKNLKHLGKEAADEIKDKFSQLADDVNSREESLIDTLAQSYMASLEEVDARIEEMKAENKGLIDAAMGFINGIIDTINKLVEMITNLFSAIQSVIPVIMADPIGFMGKLFDGIGQGIDAFKANIQKHLLGGLIEWLTGSLGPMGITIPDDIFSLKGVFSLVMQVLGLSWDYIRTKAVKMMGEPVVKALEGGFEMFTIFATKGLDGIWEYLKDQFSDLTAVVIDAIKDMLITQVIEAGIKWLLSLLIPGAGFIKAIMAIKDLIVFFVESAIMLIPAITEAILALAAGSMAGVAKAIEFGLSKLIALVIGLFAKLIGLGGLAKKVMKIFTKIRKRIDKAVMKLLMKAKKAARKVLGKTGSKEKPKNPQEHDMQVKAGLQYIDKLGKAEDKDGDKAIDDKAAKRIAVKTQKKFKVFTSITPRNEGGKWVYDWKGSSGTKKTDEKVEDGEQSGTDGPMRIKRKTIEFQPLLTSDKKVWESKTSEYRRQLKNQESAINEMKVETWIERRNTFISKETESDDNQATKRKIKLDLTETFLNLYTKKLLAKGYSNEKIDSLAKKFADSLTDQEYFRILHNPDRVAGGKAKLDYNVGSMNISPSDKLIITDVFRQLKVIGDNKVNGRIGQQWKERVKVLHDHVLPIYKTASKSDKPRLQMSVTLKIK